MEPLKLALIGCGKVAVKHLKAIRDNKQDIRLCAVVDNRLKAARELLSTTGFLRPAEGEIPIFPNIDLLLAEQTPDIVAITTPSGTHARLAKAAVSAKAHVLVEKPMTLDLAAADELLRLAESQRVKIAVGHIYRFFPLVQALAEDLHSGRFGRLLGGNVKVRWGHDQAYYEQGAWRGTWEQDGGALMNQTIHALDLMTWLLGSPVTDVFGWIDQQVHSIESEDTGYALLRLQNGSYCQVEGTTASDPERQEAAFNILCTDGEIHAGLVAGRSSFQVRDRRGRCLGGRYLRSFIAKTWREEGIKGFIRLKNPHSGLYRDFIRSIRQDRPPLADGRSGRAAVELVLAIYRSALENRPVQLPLGTFNLIEMKGFFADSVEPTV
ncbi:MAG: Gfo/Idh/MocA family oxidoreductase [Clostridiaceae bacterium]|nr:Gfo/Idh/MocA family oxidoreductase [Clostridiaceae bacterium]